MARPGHYIATREDDERYLLMLALRDKRWSSTEIGNVVGMTSGGVRAAFRKIDREYFKSEAAA